MPPIYPEKFYSKFDLQERTLFYDYPSTAAQNIVGMSTLKTTDSDFNGHNDYPNNFRFIKKISDGSASKLYLAIDPSIDKKEIVVKKISKNESWRTELNILKKLKMINDSRLLNYIGFYENERFAYILTEHYKGHDLFDHIYLNIPYSETNAKKIIKAMLKCLKVCHDNNIAHLDIKCENYMVLNMKNKEGSIDPEIVLIDFGHSEKIGHNEALCESSSYGTCYYLCPEGYDDIASMKSDIWSIGICMHLLLADDFPFDGSDDDEYTKEVMRSNLKISKKLSDPMKLFIEKCLDYNFRKRPTCDELLAML
jgi:calcium-dependent protein kinase